MWPTSVGACHGLNDTGLSRAGATNAKGEADPADSPGCMPANVQLQMFQRSFSTKGRGRGLGTYSVKLLTEKYLQGRIAFTSTSEAGTTFAVTHSDSSPLAGVPTGLAAN